MTKTVTLRGFIAASLLIGANAQAMTSIEIFNRILSNCEAFMSAPVKSNEINVDTQNFKKSFAIEPDSEVGKGILEASRVEWLKRRRSVQETERILTENLWSISESPVLVTPTLKFRVAFVNYNFFHTDYFLLVLDKHNRFISADIQGASQGRLPDDWMERYTLELKTNLKLAAQQLSAQKIERDQQKLLYEYPDLSLVENFKYYNKHGYPTVLSRGGAFMGLAYLDTIEVKSTRSQQVVGKLSLVHAKPDSVSMLDLSEDGSQVAFSYEDSRNGEKKLIVFNLKSRQAIYDFSDSEAYYPDVEFHGKGFLVALNFEKSVAPRARYYSSVDGKELQSYNLAANSIPRSERGAFGGPRKIVFNEEDFSLLLYYVDRPPVRFWPDESIREYTDVHKKPAEESGIRQMLGQGNYTLTGISSSRSFSFAAQERTYGSGIDLSLDSRLIIFDAKGEKYDELSLLWAFDNATFSPDGKYLAVTMRQQNGPVFDTKRHDKMIWVYDTANLANPKWMVKDLWILTADQVEFDVPAGNLVVRSRNSGTIHSIPLPGMAHAK